MIEISNSLSSTQSAGSGQFDYKINPNLPVTEAANVNYPAAIVDSIDFTFSYTPAVAANSTVSIQAVLENPGIWQKQITLVGPVEKSGNIAQSFHITLSQFQQQFDQIDKETGLTTSPRTVTIQAVVTFVAGSFTQNLPIILNQDVMEVGGNLQEQQTVGTGTFDYTINLKPNSIFASPSLKPPAPAETSTLPTFDLSGKPVVTTPGSPSVLSLGQTAFVSLIDKMAVNFAYQFQADKPVSNLNTSVNVVATLEAPKS